MKIKEHIRQVREKVLGDVRSLDKFLFNPSPGNPKSNKNKDTKRGLPPKLTGWARRALISFFGEDGKILKVRWENLSAG